VAFLVLSVLCAGARDVCVEEVLGDHGELGENGAVPSECRVSC
jgi:hypothetical protein